MQKSTLPGQCGQRQSRHTSRSQRAPVAAARPLCRKHAEVGKLQRHLDEALNEGRHLKRERDRLEEKLMSAQSAAGRQEDCTGRLMQKFGLMEAAMEANKNAAAQVCGGRATAGSQGCCGRCAKFTYQSHCAPSPPPPSPPLV